MARTLILHIGLSKTGTSSIQRTLAGQRDALQAAGAYYPHSPGSVNHGLLPMSVVSDRGKLWAVHPGIWEGMDPSVRLERFAQEWQAEMAALPDWAERCVISAEMISGVLTGEDEIARLAALLQPYFAAVRVVVYLRRQDQHSASAYSQWLRNGLLQPPALPDANWGENWLLDYEALLGRFAAVFGEAAMCPRIFERGRLVNGDALDDFLHVAGIRMAVPADSPHRTSNPSLRFEGQVLLRRLGEKMTAQAGGRTLRELPAWLRLAESVSESLPGNGWRPTRAAAEAYMAQFEASNESVRARYFPDQATLFANDFARLPTCEIPDEMQTDSVALACAAVTALLHEMADSDTREANAAMAEYRLARRLGDRAKMVATLMQAVRLAPDLLPARLRLAEFCQEEGNWALAAEHAAAALAVDPDSLPAQRLLRLAKRAARGAVAR